MRSTITVAAPSLPARARVVASAVPTVVSREVNAQLKALVGIQGSGPTPQAQPIWYAPAERMTTASPGVTPVTLTASRSRPSKDVMSVTVSVIEMPSRLTVGHPVTTVAVGVAVGWSAGVDVGFAVGVGGTGVGTAVGVVLEQPTSTTARSTSPDRAKPAIALSRFMDAAV
jgi:hypothetical protein